MEENKDHDDDMQMDQTDEFDTEFYINNPGILN